MKYTNTLVTARFIQHRNAFAANLVISDAKKGVKTSVAEARRRADFEWPEYYCGVEISKESGHKIHLQNEYDTTHTLWKRCEFKYRNVKELVTIGRFTQQQKFDNFVIWDWKKTVNNLSQGDVIDFKIVDVIDRDVVLKGGFFHNPYQNTFNHKKYVERLKSVGVEVWADF